MSRGAAAGGTARGRCFSGRSFLFAAVWLGAVSSLGLAAPASSSDDACLGCHLETKRDAAGGGGGINHKAFEGSVHGTLGCVDCHAGLGEYPHEPVAKVSCASCHAEEQAGFDRGLHAKVRPANGHGAPVGCLGCHGDAHAILPADHPASKTNRSNIPATCGQCHGVKFVVEPSGISTQPFFSYQKSVHGRAIAARKLSAAVCTDCHRSHDILPASDPRSPIFKPNVAHTCGSCHRQAEEEFAASIHGAAMRRGSSKAPGCTDCHGIHLIKSHIDTTSPVAFQTMARTACGQCHEGVRLSEEFGIASGRVSTYLDSYHGLASRLGSKVVANCASCHGIHKILPSSDPASKVSKRNLVKTCGECHPGAGENFARGPVHLGEVPGDGTGARINAWVRIFYLGLITAVIGGMLAHNILDFRRKLQARHPPDEKWIVRMTLSQRIQHLLLLVSFTYLALTGFALKFPDSWLAWVAGSDETVRRVGHRLSGLFLLALGGYHLIVLLATPGGRRLLRDLLPRWRDLSDVKTNFRHFLRRHAPKARFGRFGYPEKVEYWAVLWGTVIMGVTGFVIWLKLDVTRLLPRWVIEVATTIHFYEAILAILAILVWHLYQVIFDPEIYPSNPAWITGNVPEKWYRKKHSLDAEAREPESGDGKANPPT